MKTKNKQSVQIFLNKLNWLANQGEMQNIDTFRIDIYQFRFKLPLNGELLTEFTKFIQNLPIAEIRSILKIWVWLYQHDVKFKLVFSWNMNLPIKHNLKNITRPGRFHRRMKTFTHDDLMSYQCE